ncbi:MAG: tRNA (cytosine(32)/uridine(32)-2'-O)-methyltransferase TrmJ [Gammaproteobacteria bacterium]|nr:tRNA (cytosine(32)/uridine(32)-2'-O)-methyltransferase TrmJ [Gammaproteobacteria bacterium]MBU1556400.1 tRNA (cytosine(32)/uridine(32)-2'-O)-methyltransferase TrmJ [Gammaproteobacteria bacterium]MBU2068679.1 tRNA (cytosine(32)/uridine(32)-2'-O)-methyltransferase TrmJ [Gammaproteobacteria bacterium]MBU2183717.1 tRNA (cytosine(32)/uridine(32)-2'-O)-methyltransferase TrmJ [Gammaproteobacteria bacterium]MBU2205936.1 tRNA (cytosine(32)/uridine(32)-2'-O)-methyltransferase TrmJ [Gammaproteobacteria
MLDQIRIILVGTTHTGNIGSVARAMKTMGLSQLYLVAPKELPDGQAYALSAGASDILANAKVFDTLQQAITDCALVVGSSARSRTLSWPMLEPRECGVKAVQEGAKHPVALVFGRESSGLTNEELQLCNYHVCIAANPEYSSLNLAMAVQIVTYEVRMAWLQQQALQQSQPESDDEVAYPSNEQMLNFYQHLEDTLNETGFIIKQHPGVVMTKLKRLFTRARPEEAEYNILRGILTSVQRFGRKAQGEKE